MSAAFSAHDYVKYGSTGVCQIERIQSMTFSGQSEPRLYYVLRPIASPASTLFIPLDNAALTARMRYVLSKAQIDALLLRVKDREITWIQERKERAGAFHELLREGTQEDLLLLASCIYLHKQELAAAGKKLPVADEATFKEAEKLIEEEFAFSLGLTGAQVGQYIREKLGIAEQAE